jgi:hypothetical protein
LLLRVPTRGRFGEGSLGLSSFLFFRGVVIVSALGIHVFKLSVKASRTNVGMSKRIRVSDRRSVIIHAADKRGGFHVNDIFNRYRKSGIENCDVIIMKVFAQVIFFATLAGTFPTG